MEHWPGSRRLNAHCFVFHWFKKDLKNSESVRALLKGIRMGSSSSCDADRKMDQKCEWDQLIFQKKAQQHIYQTDVENCSNKPLLHSTESLEEQVQLYHILLLAPDTENPNTKPNSPAECSVWAAVPRHRAVTGATGSWSDSRLQLQVTLQENIVHRKHTLIVVLCYQRPWP